MKVPNQPIVYADDPEQMERREDESIGWTWCLSYNNTFFVKISLFETLFLMDMVPLVQSASSVMLFLFSTPLLKSGSTT